MTIKSGVTLTQMLDKWRQVLEAFVPRQAAVQGTFPFISWQSNRGLQGEALGFICGSRKKTVRTKLLIFTCHVPDKCLSLKCLCMESITLPLAASRSVSCLLMCSLNTERWMLRHLWNLISTHFRYFWRCQSPFAVKGDWAEMRCLTFWT